MGAVSDYPQCAEIEDIDRRKEWETRAGMVVNTEIAWTLPFSHLQTLFFFREPGLWPEA